MTLTDQARLVLTTAAAGEKARLSRQAAALWRQGALTLGNPGAPDRPARPERPELVLPRGVMKRKTTSAQGGRIALLHALAHIELNAIDLAWDLIARFSSPQWPRAFYDDWVKVADEEALHFTLLEARLGDLGAAYGDLPAHDGLWEAAEKTADDLLARLAIVPLVLEARGLDVTPTMIEKLQRAGDGPSVEVLQVIYRDEIGHVASGKRWFDWLAGERKLNPEEAWRGIVRLRFRGNLKKPFNVEARLAAGLSIDSCEALAQ